MSKERQDMMLEWSKREHISHMLRSIVECPIVFMVECVANPKFQDRGFFDFCFLLLWIRSTNEEKIEIVRTMGDLFSVLFPEETKIALDDLRKKTANN